MIVPHNQEMINWFYSRAESEYDTKSWSDTWDGLGWADCASCVCLIESVHLRTHKEKLIHVRSDLVVFGLS